MASDTLVNKIKDGDEKAFELLFRESYAGLVQFAWGYVRSKAIAEELVQDVFLKVWDNRKELKVTKSIESYLYKSVRNRCTDWARHSEVVKKWEDESKKDQKANESHSSSISKNLHHRLLLEEIERAIYKLPERRKEVFLLSRYENKSYKEIANLLDITVSTVETHMSKALKTLRDKFLPYLVFITAIIIEYCH